MTTTLRHCSVPRTIGDILIITRRNLLLTLRLPQVLAFSTLQPVTSMLLFTYVLGGAVGPALPPAAGGSYLNWLVPGLLVPFGHFIAPPTPPAPTTPPSTTSF